jgi:acetyl-CoA carboxylase biotin carboxylase subunit
MKRSLAETVIEGVHTTIPFLQAVMDHPAFVSGEVDTKFLERMMSERAAG